MKRITTNNRLLTSALFLLCSIPDLIITINLMENCSQCAAANRRWRQLEKDLNFEVKKLTEDLAEQKVKLEIQSRREIRHLSQRIEEEKSNRQNDNRAWITKYDEAVEMHKAEIMFLKEKHRQEIDEATVKLEKAFLTQSSLQVESMSKLRRQAQEQCQKLQEKLRQEFDESVRQREEEHQRELEQVDSEWRQRMQKEREQQNIVEKEFQKEIQASEERHEFFRKQLKENSDLISELSWQLKGKQEQIQKITEDKNRISAEKSVLKVKLSAQLEAIVDHYKQKYEQSTKTNRLRVKHLLLQQVKKIEDYEKQLQALHDVHQKQQEVYLANIREIKAELARKISPEKHYNQIASLKHEVTDKEHQCRRVNTQVQQCKLQLKNNQKVFNTFFSTSNGKAHWIRLHPPSSPRSSSNRANASGKKQSYSHTLHIPRNKRKNSRCVTAMHNMSTSLSLASTSKVHTQNCENMPNYSLKF